MSLIEFQCKYFSCNYPNVFSQLKEEEDHPTNQPTPNQQILARLTVSSIDNQFSHFGTIWNFGKRSKLFVRNNLFEKPFGVKMVEFYLRPISVIELKRMFTKLREISKNILLKYLK